MPKIKEVRVIVTCPGRNYVVVKIITDDPSLHGVGDATLNGRELAVAADLTEHIAPLLIGKDAGSIEDIWQYLYRGPYWRGGPIQMTALAGIDMALWDIKGKQANMPLYSLLGGPSRDGALCYTHAGGRDIVECEDHIRKAMEQGFEVVRAQIAVPGATSTYGIQGAAEAAAANWGSRIATPPIEGNWEPLAYLRIVPRLFEHLRSEIGDGVELLHDVHGRLTPQEASRLGRELEPFHLFFLEDPVRPEWKDGLRVVRQQTTTPLAIGELFHSRYDCLPLFKDFLIDYIRCDLSHIGGVSEAKRIAGLAEPFGVRTAWHGPGDISPIAHAANVHVDLSVPNFGVQEMVLFPPVVNEVIPGAPAYRNGRLWVTEAPGLGCDIDEEAAKKYPYDPAYLPVCRRADGAMHDW